MFSKIRYFLLLIPAIFFFLSCSDKEEWIPYIPVSKIIYLDDPDYIDLLPVGNAIILPNEGYGGIIVYHKGENEYQAFDRACTLEIDRDCVVSVGETLGIASCSCCGSEYYLILDGMVKDGPAERPLKQYHVDYDALGRRLMITN